MTILASPASAFTGESTGDFGSDWLSYERCGDIDYTLEHDIDSGRVIVRFDRPEEEGCIDIFGVSCGDSGPTYTVEGLDFSDGDPVLIQITLDDGFGNVYVYQVWSLIAIEPESPTLSLVSGPRHVVVDVVPQARTESITEEQAEAFQVQRYIGNEDTAETWVDWTLFAFADDDLYDMPVPPGVTLGYRVRWRAPDGHLSPWSSWATIAT